MKPILKKLPNGLRILLVPMVGNKTVTVMSLVQTGSKYETKKITGLSHFLEHMMFKGTMKRPTALAITSELDGLGAECNAFTGQEYTGYYVRGLAEHTEQFIDVIADIYQNPTFPKAELEKEKGVIVEEINMYHDMPDEIADEQLMELMYGDTPAGWNIAGTTEVVRSMKQSNFIRYVSDHYTATATTIVISGGIDTLKTTNLIKKYFKSIRTTKKHDKKKVVEKQSAPQLSVFKKSTQQTHMIFGFRSIDLSSNQQPALSVLSAILGSGMSSRLFQKLREEMGVCYYVYSRNQSLTDHGVFRIGAGVTNARTTEVVREIINEIKTLLRDGVTADEIIKAKSIIIGRGALGLESSQSWGMYYGMQAVHDLPLQTRADYEKKINAVTQTDIMTIAKQVFTNNNLNLSIVGPSVETTKIKTILKLGE